MKNGVWSVRTSNIWPQQKQNKADEKKQSRSWRTRGLAVSRASPCLLPWPRPRLRRSPPRLSLPQEEGGTSRGSLTCSASSRGNRPSGGGRRRRRWRSWPSTRHAGGRMDKSPSASATGGRIPTLRPIRPGRTPHSPWPVGTTRADPASVR